MFKNIISKQITFSFYENLYQIQMGLRFLKPEHKHIDTLFGFIMDIKGIIHSKIKIVIYWPEDGCQMSLQWHNGL